MPGIGGPGWDPEAVAGGTAGILRGESPEQARWEAYSHEQIYAEVKAGPGEPASAASTAFWSEAHTVLGRINIRIRDALTGMRDGYQGMAAEATVGAVNPVGAWAYQAGDRARIASDAVMAQGHSADYVRTAMPEPVSFWSAMGGQVGATLTNPVALAAGGAAPYLIPTALAVDAWAADQQADNATRRARDLMRSYSANSQENSGRMAPWEQPPNATTDGGGGVPPNGAGGGGGGIGPGGPGAGPSGISPANVHPGAVPGGGGGGVPVPPGGAPVVPGVPGGPGAVPAPGGTGTAPPVPVPPVAAGPEGPSAHVPAVTPPAAAVPAPGVPGRPPGVPTPTVSPGGIPAPGPVDPGAVWPGGGGTAPGARTTVPAPGAGQGGRIPGPPGGGGEYAAPPARPGTPGTPPVAPGELARTSGTPRPGAGPGIGMFPPMAGGAAGAQERERRRADYLLDDGAAFADDRWFPSAVITPDDPMPHE